MYNKQPHCYSYITPEVKSRHVASSGFSSCTFLLEPDWLLELLSAVPLAGLLPSPVFSSPVVSGCSAISAAVDKNNILIWNPFIDKLLV